MNESMRLCKYQHKKEIGIQGVRIFLNKKEINYDPRKFAVLSKDDEIRVYPMKFYKKLLDNMRKYKETQIGEKNR